MIDELPLKFPALRAMWVPAGELAIFILAGLVGGGLALSAGSVAGGVVGLVAAAVCVLPCYVMVRAAVLTAVLTATEIRTPRVLRGWDVVSLAELTGVGLRYRSNGRASGWRLLVWAGDEPAVSVRAKAPARSTVDGGLKIRRGLNNVVPELDWAFLAECNAGQGATAISRQARIVQGPDGPLRAERQVNAGNVGGFDTAFWSPDGRIGPLI